MIGRERERAGEGMMMTKEEKQGNAATHPLNLSTLPATDNLTSKSGLVRLLNFKNLQLAIINIPLFSDT